MQALDDILVIAFASFALIDVAEIEALANI